MGTHYFDPAPGQGRITRAYEIGLQVDPDQIQAAIDYNRGQLLAWYAIDIEEHEQGRGNRATRCEIARRLVRAQVGRVALRFSRLVRATTVSKWGNA